MKLYPLVLNTDNRPDQKYKFIFPFSVFCSKDFFCSKINFNSLLMGNVSIDITLERNRSPQPQQNFKSRLGKYRFVDVSPINVILI